jgi:hypothetical protein
VEDRWSRADAFQDWFQVLVSPTSFFQEQVGREGMNAPMSFLLACTISMTLVSFLINMVRRFSSLAGGGPFTGGSPFGVLCGGLCGWVVLLVFLLAAAGVVHGLCKMFGGQGSYAGSFRAVTYAGAPIPIFWVLGSLIAGYVVSSSAAELQRTSQVVPAPPGAIVLAQADGGFGQLGPVRGFGGSGTSGGGLSGLPEAGSTSGPSAGDRAQAARTLNLAGDIFSKYFTALLLISLPGFLWAWFLLWIALAEIHSLGAGQSAGVVMIAVLIGSIIIGLPIYLAWSFIHTVITQFTSGFAGGGAR